MFLCLPMDRVILMLYFWVSSFLQKNPPENSCCNFWWQKATSLGWSESCNANFVFSWRMQRCTKFLGYFPDPNCGLCCNSRPSFGHTMVVSGFGPYHRPVHANAPAQHAGVIPTPWAMPLTLGFGAILLGGTTSEMPIFESKLNYRIIQ